MLRAYKVFLATAYPQRDLVETMKRLFACLAICASLSASAQDDSCTVLGVQELSQHYIQLLHTIDSLSEIVADLQNAPMPMTRDSVAAISWKKELQGADLSNSVFFQQDMRWCNLENANLSNSNFQDADLRGSILNGANCTDARFWSTLLPDPAYMRCLIGCPTYLYQAGYQCVDDSDCSEIGRKKIVFQ
ncbi:pentapeptide repeat-containing protein [Flavobacteriales bacterium]|nr:pentapeptide repeat-containing protein [Flavobacteriales bacterium]